MTILCDVNDYIFSPLNEGRKTKFQKLFGKIHWKHILDLWSGYAGFYWALSYIEKIKTLDFFDFFQENINTLEEMLDEVSPEYLEKNFSETIHFLQEKWFVNSNTSYENIAQYFLEKVQEIKKFDFFDALPKNKYDTILSSEVIECVETEAEFEIGIQNIYNALSDKWEFIGNILHYFQKNSITEQLIEHKQEWKLNPDKNLLNFYLKKVGFNKIELEEIKVPRWKIIYFFAKR